MNFFLKRHPVKNLKEEPDKHPLVPIQVHEHNINEGGEFLDDAIRIKDQSLSEVEKSIGAINFDQLFDYATE